MSGKASAGWDVPRLELLLSKPRQSDLPYGIRSRRGRARRALRGHPARKDRSGRDRGLRSRRGLRSLAQRPSRNRDTRSRDAHGRRNRSMVRLHRSAARCRTLSSHSRLTPEDRVPGEIAVRQRGNTRGASSGHFPLDGTLRFRAPIAQRRAANVTATAVTVAAECPVNEMPIRTSR